MSSVCKMMIPRICYMCSSVVQEANSSQEFVCLFLSFLCVCLCVSVLHRCYTLCTWHWWPPIILLFEIRFVSEPTFRPVITNLDDLVSHNSGVTHVCTWSRLSLCRGERKVSATSLENHQFPLLSSFSTTLICVGAHTELHLNTRGI